MKKKYKIYLLFLILIITPIYMFAISTPHYSGRTVVNLDNRSFNTISNAYITFDGTDKLIALPELRPLERIVVIMPKNIFNTPTKTTAYITYYGTTTILTEEYHSLEDNSNKNKACFRESAIFEKKFVRAGSTYSVWEFYKEFPISFFEHLKPYIRIIDLNEV